MTTVALSIPMSNDTDAYFRSWGSGISNSMATLGWVKITDVAQINWNTVLKPTATSQMMGYEIWGMNDILQATYPAYVKIEYGNNSNSVGSPAIALTFGTGHNGSGTLTGQVSERIFAGPLTNSTVSYSCMISGNSSRATMVLWQSQGSHMVHFSLERGLNISAENATIGMILACGQYSSTSFSKIQFIPFTGAIPLTNEIYPCVLPTHAASSSGSNTYLYPIRSFAPGESVPILGFAGYVLTDIGQGSTLTVVDWAGNPHTYKTIGSVGSGAMGYGRANNGLAVLYE